MSDPFIAEIRIFAGNFAPRGWSFCDGQLLPIAQNTALFSLIGTIYGGDGRTTTALPNMQGRAAMHPGRGPGLTTRQLGERLGSETVVLSQNQIPSHNHIVNADQQAGNEASPANHYIADGLHLPPSNNLVDMHPDSLESVGSNQAHANQQPYLALNFIIALVGIYPFRS